MTTPSRKRKQLLIETSRGPAQLLFGEATLKEGLVPAWAEGGLEYDNWGNPLPSASEETKRWPCDVWCYIILCYIIL